MINLLFTRKFANLNNKFKGVFILLNDFIKKNLPIHSPNMDRRFLRDTMYIFLNFVSKVCYLLLYLLGYDL